VTKNLAIEPIANGRDGKPVYLKDIWPTSKEINALMKKYVTSAIFKKRYADVFKGDTIGARSRPSRAKPIAGT